MGNFEKQTRLSHQVWPPLECCAQARAQKRGPVRRMNFPCGDKILSPPSALARLARCCPPPSLSSFEWHSNGASFPFKSGGNKKVRPNRFLLVAAVCAAQIAGSPHSGKVGNPTPTTSVCGGHRGRCHKDKVVSALNSPEREREQSESLCVGWRRCIPSPTWRAICAKTVDGKENKRSMGPSTDRPAHPVAACISCEQDGRSAAANICPRSRRRTRREQRSQRPPFAGCPTIRDVLCYGGGGGLPLVTEIHPKPLNCKSTPNTASATPGAAHTLRSSSIVCRTLRNSLQEICSATGRKNSNWAKTKRRKTKTRTANETSERTAGKRRRTTIAGDDSATLPPFFTVFIFGNQFRESQSLLPSLVTDLEKEEMVSGLVTRRPPPPHPWSHASRPSLFCHFSGRFV